MTPAVDEKTLTLSSAFRETPRQVRFVLVGIFINQFGTFMQTFLVLYLLHRGFTAERAGLSLATFSVGTVLGTIVGGVLTTRLGMRATISGAMFVASACVAMVPRLADPQNEWPLLVASAAAGLSMQTYRPASTELLSQAMPERLRAVSFAMLRAAMNAGAALAPLAAALLMGLNWDLLFYFNAFCAATYGAVAWWVLRDQVAPASVVDDDTPARPAVSLIRDLPFLILLVSMVVNGATWIQTYVALPLTIEKLGHAAWTYNAVLVVSSVSLILIEMQMTIWIAGWSRTKAVTVGTVLFGLPYALFGIAGMPGILYPVVAMLIVLGISISAPTLFSHASYAPARVRPHYLGLSQAAFGIGTALGPLATGQLWPRLGLGIWPWVAVAGLVAAATGYFGVRYLPGSQRLNTAKVGQD